MDLFKYWERGVWQGGAHTLGALCRTVCEEYRCLDNEAWHLGNNVCHVEPEFPTFREMAQVQGLEQGNRRCFGNTKMTTLWVGY